MRGLEEMPRHGSGEEAAGNGTYIWRRDQHFPARLQYAREFRNEPMRIVQMLEYFGRHDPVEFPRLERQRQVSRVEFDDGHGLLRQSTPYPGFVQLQAHDIQATTGEMHRKIPAARTEIEHRSGGCLCESLELVCNGSRGTRTIDMLSRSHSALVEE